MTVTLLLQLAAALFMTGLIWFVQVVHYPLFSETGSSAFVHYEQQHVRRTSWVVIPPMVLEAATAAALVVSPAAAFPLPLASGERGAAGVDLVLDLAGPSAATRQVAGRV